MHIQISITLNPNVIIFIIGNSALAPNTQYIYEHTVLLSSSYLHT